MDNFYSDYL